MHQTSSLDGFLPVVTPLIPSLQNPAAVVDLILAHFEDNLLNVIDLPQIDHRSIPESDAPDLNDEAAQILNQAPTTVDLKLTFNFQAPPGSCCRII